MAEDVIPRKNRGPVNVKKMHSTNSTRVATVLSLTNLVPLYIERFSSLGIGSFRGIGSWIIMFYQKTALLGQFFNL